MAGTVTPAKTAQTQTNTLPLDPMKKADPELVAIFSQYSKATGTYTFMWKTAKALAGTCQVFTLGLNDGTFHRASFKFS